MKAIPIHMSRMGGPKGTAVAGGKPIGHVAHFKNHAARRRAEKAAVLAGDHDFYRVSRDQALKHAKQSDLNMVPVWRGADARFVNEIRSKQISGQPHIPKKNPSYAHPRARRKGVT
jgi:hypothetical protein